MFYANSLKDVLFNLDSIFSNSPKISRTVILYFQIVVSALIAGICADADADAFYYGAYGSYGGAALGYPYAYAHGYARPAVAAAHVVAAPAVCTFAGKKEILDC